MYLHFNTLLLFSVRPTEHQPDQTAGKAVLTTPENSEEKTHANNAGILAKSCHLLHQ